MSVATLARTPIKARCGHKAEPTKAGKPRTYCTKCACTAGCGHKSTANGNGAPRALCSSCRGTALCGHAVTPLADASKRRTECEGCADGVALGTLVRLEDGVGQVWDRSDTPGWWWIADGASFIKMSRDDIETKAVASLTDDVDALFDAAVVGPVAAEPAADVPADGSLIEVDYRDGSARYTVSAITGGVGFVQGWSIRSEVDGQSDYSPALPSSYRVIRSGPAVAVDARPVAVTEDYRRLTHDVDYVQAGRGAVMTRCGVLLATDPDGQAARRGAAHGTVHGQDRIGETMCGQCVAVAEAATYGADALRPVEAAAPAPPHADTRTDTGRVVSDAPADAPVAILATDIYGRGCIVVRTDVATVLHSAQRDGWQEWPGVGAGRSRTFEDGSPVADAVLAVLAAVQGYDRTNAPGGNPFPYGRDVAELAGWSCPVIPADVWDPMTRHYVTGAHAEWFAGILPVGRAASAAHYAGESDDDRECGWEFYG